MWKKCVKQILLLVAVALLPGCSTEKSGLEAGIPQDVSITVYTNVAGSEENNPFASGVLKMYEKFSYSDVNFVFFASDETDEMIRRITEENASGNGPDLVVLGSENESIPGLYALIAGGVLQDLSHYMSLDTKLIQPEIDECAFAPGKIEGKQLLISDSAALTCLLSTENRLSVQSVDTEALKRGTLEGFAAGLKQAVAARSGEGTYVLGPDVTPSMLLAASGVELVDGNLNYSAEPERLRAIIGFTAQLFSGMNLTDAKPADSGQKLFSYTTNETMFLCERSPGLTASSASAGQVYLDFLSKAVGGQSVASRLLFYTLPSDDGKIHTTPNRVYGVCTASKNKEAAWLFARFMLDKESQTSKESFTNALPVRISVRKDVVISLRDALSYISQGMIDMKDIPVDADFLNNYIGVLENLSACTIYDAGAAGIYNREVYRFCSGEIDLDACLNEIETGINMYLAELAN